MGSWMCYLGLATDEASLLLTNGSQIAPQGADSCSRLHWDAPLWRMRSAIKRCIDMSPDLDMQNEESTKSPTDVNFFCNSTRYIGKLFVAGYFVNSD